MTHLTIGTGLNVPELPLKLQKVKNCFLEIGGIAQIMQPYIV